MVSKYVVRLTTEERQRLSRLISVGKAAAYRRKHAAVLLKVDEGDGGSGWTDEKATESCAVSVRTVANLRRRFVEQGLEAALNRQKQSRLSRQPILDGEKEAKLVALCCGTVPAGHGRWTLRLLADKLVELEIVDSISHETVRQYLKKTS